ncbi:MULTISPECIES: LCP family protein [unclassified Enterococcus]|uniref:LCP family glycopolymer transferase n=1 Tax=unclassified Enterococcus TaxID=2608891 RepID=UPI001CE08130|nr:MULTISPECIES: LCP family protein [unclassified Enterococcus]MCA5014444.1 LCP family protein [Enterococcus sp. S23]MCA5017442.1 LCP family protein [Enterococcus sp. S22(2020)]
MPRALNPERNKSLKKILKIVCFSILGVLIVAGGSLLFLYHDISSSFEKTYEAVRTEGKSNYRPNYINLQEKAPFSVLLLGIDSGYKERMEQGRSDTIMYATLNPKKKQTQIMSIPRDTYTEIVGLDINQKINQAYEKGGTEMTVNTVEKFLQLPVDRYISLNMQGLEDLVDIVEGIEVMNKFEFTDKAVTFKKGKITLNGKEALIYCRMRKEDPVGDYGRQERQRLVVQGIGSKLIQPSVIVRYRDILYVLEKNMKSDFSWLDLQTIALEYRTAFMTIENTQLQGTGLDTGDGLAYQQIALEELQTKRNQLLQNLNLNEDLSLKE